MEYTNAQLDKLIEQGYEALKKPLDRDMRDKVLYSLMVLEAKRHKQSTISISIH